MILEMTNEVGVKKKMGGCGDHIYRHNFDASLVAIVICSGEATFTLVEWKCRRSHVPKHPGTLLYEHSERALAAARKTSPSLLHAKKVLRGPGRHPKLLCWDTRSTLEPKPHKGS